MYWSRVELIGYNRTQSLPKRAGPMGSLDDDVRDERNVYANSGPEVLLKRLRSPSFRQSGSC